MLFKKDLLQIIATQSMENLCLVFFPEIKKHGSKIMNFNLKRFSYLIYTSITISIFKEISPTENT